MVNPLCMGRVPNLFIPGFQKCATSSLFVSLTRHPEITGPAIGGTLDPVTFPKEVHFFDNHFDRGIDFYSSLFDEKCLYALDATPNYFANHKAFSRLVQLVPDPKLVIGLRDPVDRLVSAWNHLGQLSESDKWPIPVPGGTLEENIEAEIMEHSNREPGGGLFGMGCYGSHIEFGIQLVGRDRFCFTFSEWLEKSFYREISRIHRFLQLKEISFGKERAHVREKTTLIDDETIIWLRELYRDECLKLEEILRIQLPWDWYK